MTLHIEINLDNAAFKPFHGCEAARLLRKLAHRIDGERCTIGDITPLIDANGNKVGTAEVVE